ncbi:MAG TPA: TrkA C-terminal domain-containing protein [bacterium]|nr:TrkA C-terminal domain-containing protein [bacterium]
MVPLFTLIIIITLSVLITRIATIALIHTGLSKESAKFQARSALTGVGFTTNEAEGVVGHPVRRRIILTLMLIGNAGIISVIASLMFTFMNIGEGGISWYFRLLILICSISVLWLLSRSRWVERGISSAINLALDKFTSLKVRDYVKLLDLSGDYEITEIKVHEDDWLVNKTLGELNLRNEGINVIGIYRTDGTYIGIAGGDTPIEVGDQLILYGREETLKNLDTRKKDVRADMEHMKAVAEMEQVKEQHQPES